MGHSPLVAAVIQGAAADAEDAKQTAASASPKHRATLRANQDRGLLAATKPTIVLITLSLRRCIELPPRGPT
jgi:hypothetical protein